MSPLRPRKLVFALVLGLGAACVAERKIDPIAGNLLVGAKIETGGVPNTDRLVDGRGAQEGDFWDTPLTARFERPDAQVTWDLGQEKAVQCALVQGDNNDSYLLTGSPDGKTWTTFWEAPPVSGAGLRLRQGDFQGKARFVRLTATGGDQAYSVGEIALFATCPAGWPKFDLPRADAVSPDAGSVGGVWTVSLGLFALALVVFIVLTRRRSDSPLPPPDENPAG